MLEHSWLRRLAGWAWLAAWSGLLYLVASPWADLGGIVDERLRWFHRFSLCMGLAAGVVAGLHGREAGEGRGTGYRRRWYRLAWYPLAGFTVVLMVALAVSRGRAGEIGILFTGFLASCASFWVSAALRRRPATRKRWCGTPKPWTGRS
jgi:hypothetical protein